MSDEISDRQILEYHAAMNDYVCESCGHIVHATDVHSHPVSTLAAPAPTEPPDVTKPFREALYARNARIAVLEAEVSRLTRERDELWRVGREAMRLCRNHHRKNGFDILQASLDAMHRDTFDKMQGEISRA